VNLTTRERVTSSIDSYATRNCMDKVVRGAVNGYKNNDNFNKKNINRRNISRRARFY